MRRSANEKAVQKMKARRVLLIAIILGASAMAAQGKAKGILGQSEGMPLSRDDPAQSGGSPEERRAALKQKAESDALIAAGYERLSKDPKFKELFKLVDDTLAGKDNEADIQAYQKKRGITLETYRQAGIWVPPPPPKPFRF
jgi:hypothetical protein